MKEQTNVVLLKTKLVVFLYSSVLWASAPYLLYVNSKKSLHTRGRLQLMPTAKKVAAFVCMFGLLESNGIRLSRIQNY